MNSIRTCRNLLKHFIFDHMLVIEDYEQAALRMQLVFSPVEERCKITTLRKPYC